MPRARASGPVTRDGPLPHEPRRQEAVTGPLPLRAQRRPAAAAAAVLPAPGAPLRAGADPAGGVALHRHGRLPVLRAPGVARRLRERLHAARWHGPGEQSHEQRREAVRRLVRALRRPRVHRDRERHPRPAAASHAAPLPRRRARQMMRTVTTLSLALALIGVALEPALGAEPPARKPPTTAEVLAASSPS